MVKKQQNNSQESNANQEQPKQHSDSHSGQHGGHDHSGHEIMFRNRFWVSLALSIPVLLYSETIQGWLNFTMPTFPGSQWITPLFSVIIFLYGGVPLLKIDAYFAEVLPADKDKKVSQLQEQGQKVMMVGDGVNDAPALTRADIGVAIGSGTDVAVESGGIILVKNNPLDVVKMIELSQASYRKMVQNLIWASGYNIIALPLATGILAPIGFVLSPAVGALVMSLSTIIVAINA
jgi:cation transport ATPase